MLDKEGASLLPTSSTSVRNAKAEGGRLPIKGTFQWLQITSTALTFCWLAFLTFRSFPPETAPVMTVDMMRQLMTSQEVRGSGFKSS